MEVAGDFETASCCDLRKCGAARYAVDPSTYILSFKYVVLNERLEIVTPMALWVPNDREATRTLQALASDPAVGFSSHASFEQEIWREIMVPAYGFAPIPVERWVDTQSIAAYHGLPLSLDGALRALYLPVVKDLVGRKVTLGLSRADKHGNYPVATADTLATVYAYNEVDVDAVVALRRCLGVLPGRERMVWELDQHINQRGVAIDIPLVYAAKRLVNKLKAPLEEEFRQLTGFNPGQRAKLLEWLETEGAVLPNLQKQTIEDALNGESEGLVGLSEPGFRALYIRSLVSSSSLSKLDRMWDVVGMDNRARYLQQYHAASTGRWAGRLIQPQNFPRPPKGVKPYDIDEVVATIREGGDLSPFGEPLEVLVASLRHCLIADDWAQLGSGDFAGVEARLVLALAGQHDKCALLAEGADVYRDMAADIFGLDKRAYLSVPKGELTPQQTEWRQTGKNTILGCGFGMGWKKFWVRYCPKQSHEFAKKAINAYRKTWAPLVPKLWKAVERAALQAMLHPGQVHETHGLLFKVVEHGGHSWLAIKLLNGKKLFYYHPQVRRSVITFDHTGERIRSTPWDGRTWVPDHDSEGNRLQASTYWEYQSSAGGIMRWTKAYGGLLVENIVQAMAREMLVDAMFAFDQSGWPIVLTVHDEIVIESPHISKKILRDHMIGQSPWADAIGMPIEVDCWVGERYRK